MGMIIAIVAILGGCFVAVVNRLLAHKERMAMIEAKRPKIVLQLPDAPGLEHDDLTEQILAACKAKGIDVDLELEERPKQLL